MAWRPDSMAEAVDAFSMDWTQVLLYPFPPFNMVSRTLHKLWEDEAEALLIIPYWVTQSWFPQVMRSLAAQPVFLPASEDLLRLPYDQDQVHPLHERLSLLACHVSGKPCAAKKFAKGCRHP